MRARGERWLLMCCTGLLVAAGGVRACAAVASSPRAATVQLQPIRDSDEVRVRLRDLESLGLGRVQWDAAAQVGVLIGRRATLEFRAGDREVGVQTVTVDGRQVRARHVTGYPPVMVEGKLMVPLRFTCAALGEPLPATAGPTGEPPPPRPLAAEDHPEAQAKGAITGLVVYGRKPLAGIVLRLVRDEDSAFLPDRRAVTDEQGRYRFPGVGAGRYRVYTYVADNPDYFNRETPPVVVEEAEVAAPPIALGRVVRPVAPPAGGRVAAAARLRVAWTPCPEAARYEISATDPETHEEVAFQVVTAPQAEVSTASFVPGHWYQWRVLALGEDGGFLGATPGAGGEPWRFMVLSGAGQEETCRDS